MRKNIDKKLAMRTPPPDTPPESNTGIQSAAKSSAAASPAAISGPRSAIFARLINMPFNLKPNDQHGFTLLIYTNSPETGLSEISDCDQCWSVYGNKAT
jgi:hypothetical protein